MDPAIATALGSPLIHDAVDACLQPVVNGLVRAGMHVVGSCSGMLRDHTEHSKTIMEHTPTVAVHCRSRQESDILAQALRIHYDEFSYHDKQSSPYLQEGGIRHDGYVALRFPMSRSTPLHAQVAQLCKDGNMFAAALAKVLGRQPTPDIAPDTRSCGYLESALLNSHAYLAKRGYVATDLAVPTPYTWTTVGMENAVRAGLHLQHIHVAFSNPGSDAIAHLKTLVSRFPAHELHCWEGYSYNSALKKDLPVATLSLPCRRDTEPSLQIKQIADALPEIEPPHRARHTKEHSTAGMER